jgi:hypothetical protein
MDINIPQENDAEGLVISYNVLHCAFYFIINDFCLHYGEGILSLQKSMSAESPRNFLLSSSREFWVFFADFGLRNPFICDTKLYISINGSRRFEGHNTFIFNIFFRNSGLMKRKARRSSETSEKIYSLTQRDIWKERNSFKFCIVLTNIPLYHKMSCYWSQSIPK